MAPQHHRLSLGSLLLAALLSACAVPPHVAAPAAAVPTPVLLAGTEWVAFAIDGVPEVLAPKPRLRWVSVDQVSGTGGCNPFRGRAVVSPGSLVLGPLASMGRACLSMPGSQEDMFFKALELTRKGRLDRDQLVLTDDSGKILARFLKAN
jgi:heat shock protein HslJ